MQKSEKNMDANSSAVLEAVNKIYDLVSKPCVVIEDVRQACREARAVIIDQPTKIGNAAAKKCRRTKTDNPSKHLHKYWREHYEV